MATKKITLEMSDSQYKNFLKIIALGEFAFQGHKQTNKHINQMISSICAYADKFNCEGFVTGPNLIDGCYEIDPDFMSDIIDKYMDIVHINDEEDMRFMLKGSM